MRIESLGASYLALPDGAGPHPGVVVIHEASGLNDNIREICRRFAAEGYAALGVDLFETMEPPGQKPGTKTSRP
jgi:carboxymethylenebutenolidase